MLDLAARAFGCDGQEDGVGRSEDRRRPFHHAARRGAIHGHAAQPAQERAEGRAEDLVLAEPRDAQVEGELLAARADDPPLHQHVHEVRLDVVEDSLVVGDENDGAIGAAEAVDAFGDGL